LQSQWYHANTFLPLKEENNSKNDPEIAGPKVSIIKRFHCITYVAIVNLYIVHYCILGYMGPT